VALLTVLATLALAQNSAPPKLGAGYVHFITRPNKTVEIQTAAVRLVADGKPVVWLVGAIHVGTRSYYSSIQRLLAYQDAVFYEGVRDNSTPLPITPPQKGQQVTVYTTFSKALGLDFQPNDIDYSGLNWTNVDLTMEDLNKLNAAESGGKPSQFDQVRELLKPDSPMAKQFAAAIGQMTPGMKEAIKLVLIKSAGAEAMTEMSGATERIIITARNKAVIDALAAAFAQPKPPHSIGVFYGAGHMPGLQKTLTTQYGYHVDTKLWFGAADADPKKVDSTGKAILGMIGNFDKPMKGGG